MRRVRVYIYKIYRRKQNSGDEKLWKLFYEKSAKRRVNDRLTLATIKYQYRVTELRSVLFCFFRKPCSVEIIFRYELHTDRILIIFFDLTDIIIKKIRTGYFK